MGETRSVLNQNSAEKDLGVTFASNLKFSSHIRAQANKATSILGQLRRSFRFWTNTTFKTLYCAYVRPHLEYAAVVWFPYTTKDISTHESTKTSY
jgi:hypothetical protein